MLDFSPKFYGNLYDGVNRLILGLVKEDIANEMGKSVLECLNEQEIAQIAKMLQGNNVNRDNFHAKLREFVEKAL